MAAVDLARLEMVRPLAVKHLDKVVDALDLLDKIADG
jgi:hypothetical protein